MYIITRRRFLYGTALGAAALAAPGGFAEALALTPRQTAGPFYPDALPLDTDNDLLVVNDSLTQAVGEVTHLTGHVLDASGAPLRNATVEIWQVDARGVYLHSASPDREAYDQHFQGYGRFLTDAEGRYYFRTIKPVPYRDQPSGRTPHIHFAVKKPGIQDFTTQCYIKGHPQNEQDSIFLRAAEAASREAIAVDFSPLPDSPANELAAHFDIVIGVTPQA